MILLDLIEGWESEERAVVFIMRGDKSVVRLAGMDEEEAADYLRQVSQQLQHNVDVEAELRRIAGSERKQ